MAALDLAGISRAADMEMAPPEDVITGFGFRVQGSGLITISYGLRADFLASDFDVLELLKIGNPKKW